MTDAVLGAPGLYLRALEGGGTPPLQSAVTAFVGTAERGPLDAPQTLGSFGDFLEVFGGFWGFGALAESVYAFFLNGGEEACVTRVARVLPPGAGGAAACAVREDLAAAGNVGAILDRDGAETLRLSARSPGAWGNRLRARLFAEGTREMEVTRLSASASPGANQVRVDWVQDFAPGGKLRLVHRDNVFARSEHTVTVVDAVLSRLTLLPPLPREYPVGSAVLAPGFRLEAEEGGRRESFDNLSMNPSHPRFFPDVINGTPGLPALEAARAGHSSLVRAERVPGGGGTSRFKPADSPAKLFSGGGDGLLFARAVLPDALAAPALQAAARLRGRAGNTLRVRARPFTGALALPVPPAPGAPKDRLTAVDVRGWAAGDSLTITHAANSALSETVTVLSVLPDVHALFLGTPLVNDYPLGSALSAAGRFNLEAEDTAASLPPEVFRNLSLSPGPRFFRDIVNGVADPAVSSRLVCVDTVPAAAAPPVGEATLSGGTDPHEVDVPALTGYLEDGSYFADPARPGLLGMAALEARAEVNLVCLPDLGLRADLSQADFLLAQRQLLEHCRRSGERFALLDTPRGFSPEAALAWPANFSAAPLALSPSAPAGEKLPRFGALYYPWVLVALPGADRLLPPSGTVAGILARSDRSEGLGRAPANFPCKGVVALEREVDAEEQGALNLRGVNCLRKFEDGAIRLWGARTLSGEANQLYVHHRRVLLAAVKALSRNLRWAVFEPNDARLRRRIKDSLEGYFASLLARGLAAGARPEDAYYVKVDEELNGPEIQEAGQIIAEVGIALDRPSEFIVLAVRRRPESLALVEEEI